MNSGAKVFGEPRNSIFLCSRGSSLFRALRVHTVFICVKGTIGPRARDSKELLNTGVMNSMLAFVKDYTFFYELVGAACPNDKYLTESNKKLIKNLKANYKGGTVK